MASSSPSPLVTGPCSSHLPPKPRQVISYRRSPAEDEKERPLPPPPPSSTSRREIILRSSELATLAAIFHFRLLHLSGSPPLWDKAWLSRGAEESPALALCPATNNCVSTSEDAGDSAHYAPPWNYNPEDGRGPVSREAAMAELLEVVKSTNANGFTPRIAEKKDDYLRVEYESPIMGFVDDVEFWFPPGEKPLVNYRSASRLGILDFDVNRKRIKALRQSLEKKGWASESGF